MALAWLPAAQAAEVDVQLRLLAPDALEVSYTLPPECRTLSFLKNGEDGRVTRASWAAQDECGAAGADQLSRGKDACPVLRFRVPAATRQLGYPAAFPMGQGLYVHLSNYAVTDSCGKVNYRFAAPGIAVNGRAYRGSAVAQAGADSAALMLANPLDQHAAEPPAYFDPRLPPAAVAQIKAVADGTVAYLRAALPDAEFRRPIVAAAAAAEPGGPNVGGDAGEVLRLALFNWPRDPSPSVQAKLTLLVAHEFSHRFQLRDAVDMYPDARLIHEGGGEFLRWMTSMHEGWMTPEQAADDLDQALTECVLSTDQQSWRGLTPRFIGGNRLEYRCGLAAYVYVLAARQGGGSALARINRFYQELRQGNKPDFGQALECGASAPCQGRWLAPLLGADGPMEQQWVALFRDTGLALPHSPTQPQKDAMVLRALIKLMKDDCGGRSGSTRTPDGVILDGMTACKSFTHDVYVTAIEGLPVFGHAATGRTMAAACATRRSVVLGVKDGATLTVPCVEPYRMRQEFYRADIRKVLAALRRE